MSSEKSRFGSILRALALALAAATATPVAATEIAVTEQVAMPVPEVAEADQLAISAVVRRGLEGLLANDAAEAYAAVSPQAHRVFPTKEIYLASMLERYTPLAYATWFELGDVRQTSRGIAQMVRFADRRGRPFMSFFILENGEAGWRIIDLIMVEMPANGA